jgi:hypothetical protein
VACASASGQDVIMREAVIIGAGWRVTLIDIDAPLVATR